MPFKIVSTRIKGKVELCTVPESWELKGILRWPKIYADILAKNESTQPQADWLNYNCIVKRKNFKTYDEAEEELVKMLEKTDTDETDNDEQQSYNKRTITPTQKILNLNAAAQRLMTKSGNKKKRENPTIQAGPTIQASPTVQASPIIQASPTIAPSPTVQAGPIIQVGPTMPANQNIPAIPITQASPIIQLGPTIQANQNIPASPITQACPTIQAGQIIQASSTLQTDPIIQASPTIPASPTVQADPFTQPYPTIQRFAEASVVTHQQPYIIDQTLYSISTEEQQNKSQEIHYYTDDQSMTTQINNLYEIQTAILDNQNKIMKKLAEISVQLQEIQGQNTENITVTTLAQAKGAETERMRIDVVDNIESLEKLEKELSCPKKLKTKIEKYAILCSAAPGSGSNCAYRLLDSTFTKDFLCQCSWTGGSRGDNLKIGFKKFKNVLKFFFQMVHYWDNTYTIQDNENFFKNILRNALKRKTSKNIRQSSKKRRQPKTNNDDGKNSNNNGEENVRNGDEVNINDDDSYDPNDENTNNSGNNNTNNDRENYTSNENEAVEVEKDK